MPLIRRFRNGGTVSPGIGAWLADASSLAPYCKFSPIRTQVTSRLVWLKAEQKSTMPPHLIKLTPIQYIYKLKVMSGFADLEQKPLYNSVRRLRF